MNRRRRLIRSGGTPQLPVALGAPYFAFGMTKLVSGYTGAAFQGQDSGATTTDIGFSGGKADSAAAASAGVVTGKIWYDQSGNSRNMTNNGVNARPTINPTYGIYNTMTMMFGIVDSTSVVTQNIETANTLSINKQAFTLYIAFNPMTSLRENTHFEFRSGGSNTLNSYTENANAGIKSFGSGSTNTSVHPRSQMSVIAITFSASGRSYYYRGQKISVAAASAGTADQLTIGNSSFGGAYDAKGHYAAIVGYSAAHNDSEVASVTAVLEAAYAVPTTFTSRIVGSGDSIMRGIYVMKNFMSTLDISGAELFNIGVENKTMTNIYANRTTNEGALYTSAYGAGKCYTIQEGGINDIFTSAVASGAALYTLRSDMDTYCSGLGYKTIQATLIPSAGLDAPKTTIYNDFNALVIANSVGADAIADVKTTLTLGSADYVSDNVHPSTLGHSKLAPVYKAAILAA